MIRQVSTSLSSGEYDLCEEHFQGLPTEEQLDFVCIEEAPMAQVFDAGDRVMLAPGACSAA